MPLTSAAEAVAHIQPGDRVFVGSDAAEPAERERVEIYSLGPGSLVPPADQSRGAESREQEHGAGWDGEDWKAGVGGAVEEAAEDEAEADQDCAEEGGDSDLAGPGGWGLEALEGPGDGNV